MTLIEQQQTAKTTPTFYYVTPIVRDLLVEHEGTSSPFLQEKAGAYFEYILTEQDGNIGDMEEAYYHQDVGNKTNESKALHNISQIYDARGDYKTALKYYLEQSLKIKQNIGDKSSLLPTMHNMGQAYLKQKNIPKYLEYVYPAYQLANEIKNAMGIYTIGGNLGEFLCRTGQIEKGLPILKKSYAIAQKMNLPNLDQLATLIQKYEAI